MTGVWARLKGLLEAGTPAALVTVVEVRGSAPREPGARMIVTNGGEHVGTIGGGALEWEAIDVARRQAGGRPGASLRRLSLGPELGQCCGGQVTLLIEAFAPEDAGRFGWLMEAEEAGPVMTLASIREGAPLERRPIDERGGPAVAFKGNTLTERFGGDRQPLALFGAGHVGRAVMLALAPLPFRITWIDSRRDAFPTAMPRSITAIHTAEPEAMVGQIDRGAFVLVMTYSHPMDLAICHAALASGRFVYVGLIGSETKRARFASRLRAAGLDAADIARLHCPIGLPGLTGKTPETIAASVAADLLMRKERRDAEASVDFSIPMQTSAASS